ncbi:MAG: DUF2189 domain-containing protein [Hyphomicrobiaceae bacterium]|nr:MAG: DUF2189 domain-containing protein [Hyphomicrobiaceae bacterium]
MDQHTTGTKAQREGSLPTAISLERVPFDAPWDWLAAGWRDMWAIPGISLAYGAVFALLSIALTFGLMEFGLQSLILALGGGFLLIGPLFAVGLYEASRRLEIGAPVSMGEIVSAGFRAPGQLGFFGAVLAFVFFVWVQLAFLLFMLFMGATGLPPPSEFVPALLFTPRGLGLLVVGTIVGGILAATVFAMSAISVPLLMTRRIDAVTAIRTSFTAVIENPKPMLLWAALIAAFTLLGIATLFVGLVVVFPLVGHATWHAFRSFTSKATS